MSTHFFKNNKKNALKLEEIKKILWNAGIEIRN